MPFLNMKSNGHNPAMKTPIHMPVVKRIMAFLACTGVFQKCKLLLCVSLLQLAKVDFTPLRNFGHWEKPRPQRVLFPIVHCFSSVGLIRPE